MLFSDLPYLASLLPLALLWTVAVVTPGPNFFNTAQLAASCSRRHGVVASAGVATGTIIWGLAGGLGIKSLFTAAPMLYLAFKIIGGCYLIYLGLKLFKRSAPTTGQAVLPDEPRRSLFSAWRFGLLGNLSNPKAALFVATLLHDIAKGRRGDHSVLGAEVAMKLCPRLGMTEAEIKSILQLIQS